MLGDDEMPSTTTSHAVTVEFWHGVGVLDVTKCKPAPLIVVVVGWFTAGLQIVP